MRYSPRQYPYETSLTRVFRRLSHFFRFAESGLSAPAFSSLLARFLHFHCPLLLVVPSGSQRDFIAALPRFSHTDNTSQLIQEKPERHHETICTTRGYR